MKDLEYGEKTENAISKSTKEMKRGKKNKFWLCPKNNNLFL